MTSKEGESFSMPSASSTPITGSTSTTDGTLVSKRRKLTSDVWNDFDKIIENGQDYVICKHCKGNSKKIQDGEMQAHNYTYESKRKVLQRRWC